MNFNFKNAMDVLAKNPSITLLLVTYFLILATVTGSIFANFGKPVFYVGVVLLFVFSAAFLAGWFGMIKAFVTYKETGNTEVDFKNRYTISYREFFSSVPVYMLSIIFYIFLFIMATKGIMSLSDYFFGKPDTILQQLLAPNNTIDAISNMIATMPEETKLMLAKRSIFIYSSSLLYLFLTFFSVPALFFSASKNPLVGLKDGICAIAKKPFFSIMLFLAVIFSHVVLIFAEAISTVNQILMFLAMVLRICFIAYVVVLIFSVYEKNFTSDCNNGPDCIG